MQVFSEKSFDYFKSFHFNLLFSEKYSTIKAADSFSRPQGVIFLSFLLNNTGPNLVIMLCIRLLIVFTILPIHEYAHGYAAKKLGDNTALIAGRLTLNPLAHIHPIGSVLLILFGFGWAKPVPVNPRNFKNYKRDMAITAFAGPLSNLICSLIGIFASKVLYNIFARVLLSQAAAVAISYALMALNYFAIINLSLAIFNLLPIRPLDGSNILAYFLPAKANAFLYKYTNYIQIGLFALIYLGILSGPLSWLVSKVYDLFTLLFFWVDLLFGVIFK